jgi:RNA polymerase sigma-70 factor (ECF subfamily)
MKVAALVEDGAWARVRDQETEWVRRHRSGDTAAFEEVYQSFGRMVYGVALRMTGSAEDAADLAQEVFLRVHRHLGRFRHGSSLRTWIYRITINRCRSHLRRRRPFLTRWLAEDAPAADAEVLLVPDPGRGPEALAGAQDTRRRVETALRTLPRVYREAVVLRDLDELEYEEIAAVLRLPLGTVRSRIARGRERLRQALETRS